MTSSVMNVSPTNTSLTRRLLSHAASKVAGSMVVGGAPPHRCRHFYHHLLRHHHHFRGCCRCRLKAESMVYLSLGHHAWRPRARPPRSRQHQLRPPTTCKMTRTTPTATSVSIAVAADTAVWCCSCSCCRRRTDAGRGPPHSTTRQHDTTVTTRLHGCSSASTAPFSGGRWKSE